MQLQSSESDAAASSGVDDCLQGRQALIARAQSLQSSQAGWNSNPDPDRHDRSHQRHDIDRGARQHQHPKDANQCARDRIMMMNGSTQDWNSMTSTA